MSSPNYHWRLYIHSNGVLWPVSMDWFIHLDESRIIGPEFTSPVEAERWSQEIVLNLECYGECSNPDCNGYVVKNPTTMT